MTAAVARESETYLPLPGAAAEIAQVRDFLAVHAAAGRGVVAQRYLLVGAANCDVDPVDSALVIY